jgi:hypothetical protein
MNNFNLKMKKDFHNKENKRNAKQFVGDYCLVYALRFRFPLNVQVKKMLSDSAPH